MHRIHNRIVLPWRSLVVALIVAACGGFLVTAQETTSPQLSALIVPINGTIKLQMSKKQKIKTVVNPKESAVSIRTLAGDPTTILLSGQQPDVTHIELEDTDGNKETYEVIVQADVEYLRSQLRRALPTANVMVIPTSNNTVILSGTVTHAQDVAVVRGLVQSIGFKYIDSLRVGGVQQVQLDVIIAQVNRTDLRNLTFNFLGNSKYAAGGSTVGGSASVGGGSSGGASSGLFPTSAGSLAGTGLAATPAGATNLLLGFVHNAWGFQNFLEALRDNGLAKLLAEPRLVTLSGRPASFLVGGQQAVPMAAGFSGVGVQFVPFGTTLSFLPIVLGNGKIYIEVSPSVSSIDAANGVTPAGGGFVPGRDINSVTTTIELEPGQTFVIGGLIQHKVDAFVRKVPCLGDIPCLGMFFRSTQYQDVEQEVIVVVTPWLVDSESCNQRPKILPGEETRRPDNFELFLEGIIEAPRGPRQVKQDHHYVPAWMNSPTASTFPCVGKKDCNGSGCAIGGGSCGVNGCGGAADGLFPPAGSGPVTPPNPLPQSGMPAPLTADTTPTTPASTTAMPAPSPLEPPLRPVPGEGGSAPPADGQLR
jgi:pilus assembly protein CpaC